MLDFYDYIIFLNNIILALKQEDFKKDPNILMNSSFDELTQETSTDPEEPKRIYQQNESVRRLSQNRRPQQQQHEHQQQQKQRQPDQHDQVQYDREQKGQIKYHAKGSSVETDSSGIYSAATENNRMANIVRKISRMNLEAMDQLDTRSVCSMRSVGSIRSATMSPSRLAKRNAPEDDAQSTNLPANGLGRNFLVLVILAHCVLQQNFHFLFVS